MLTLGQLLDEMQADYLPGLSELKVVRRAVGRIMNDMSSKLNGVNVFDIGLEMVIAPTTESVIFDQATRIVPTTTHTTVIPGDVIVVYDSNYNNKAYPISDIASGEILTMAANPVFTETKEVTYAIYRPWRKYAVKDVVHAELTYNNTTHTITSASTEIDFLEVGAKVGDSCLIAGATEAFNNSLYEIAVLTATVITVKTNGHTGGLTNDTDDPGLLSILSPVDDHYTYDLEHHRLSIPPSAKKLQQIYQGNINSKVSQKSDVFLNKAANDDEEVYSTTARNSYSLSPDIFTAVGDILTFKVRRSLVAPKGAYRDAEIEIPQSFETALKYGVLKDLLSLPKYSNKDTQKEQNSLYMGALAELRLSEDSRNKPVVHERDYLW